MSFYRAKNCLTLFLAVLPVFCRGHSPPGCHGSAGEYYAIGQLMPSSNPCNVDCECKAIEQMECSIMDCPKPPCEKFIHIEGQCCPVCGSCSKDGVVYNTGQIVNNDPCHPCTCQERGEVTCDNIQCSNLTCKYQVVPKGKCCPVCQCRQGNTYYFTGEIVQNVECNPLICQSNGSIKAESVACEKLQCIDPVIPIEKCCPECKNGRTCARKTVIIKYGEDKMIGNEICRCGGDPWFPNAFCAEKNVSEKLLEDFGRYLANYEP